MTSVPSGYWRPPLPCHRPSNHGAETQVQALGAGEGETARPRLIGKMAVGNGGGGGVVDGTAGADDQRPFPTAPALLMSSVPPERSSRWR